MKLKHYYHLYAAGEWRDPVAEHVIALKESGLIDEIGEVLVGVVGNEFQVSQALAFLDESGIPYQVIARQEEGWEQVTMNVMYNDAYWNSPTDPFYCLYAHTKGAQYQYDLQAGWRRTMTKWNVYEWRQAVASLENGAAASGCMWQASIPEHPDAGPWYYAGNYFWADSTCMGQVYAPKMNSRYDAEVWIGQLAHLGKPMNQVYEARPHDPDDLLKWET